METLLIFIRGIICGLINCNKRDKRVVKFAGKSARHTLRERIYSKSLQSLPKYQYLENLLTPVEEIGHFMYSNNVDIVSPSKALPNSIFIFDEVACEQAIREYFSMGRHADCFYLCQTYAKVHMSRIIQ